MKIRPRINTPDYSPDQQFDFTEITVSQVDVGRLKLVQNWRMNILHFEGILHIIVRI